MVSVICVGQRELDNMELENAQRVGNGRHECEEDYSQSKSGGAIHRETGRDYTALANCGRCRVSAINRPSKLYNTLLCAGSWLVSSLKTTGELVNEPG